MNDELLKKAAELFDTPDKWNAFCELCRRKCEIENYWWRKLHQKIVQLEKENGMPDWDICVNDENIWWYIKGENDDTLLINFWKEDTRVYYEDGLNSNEVKKYLKNPKIEAIKNCFDRNEGSDEKEVICLEKHNSSFGDKVSEQTFLWFSGNKTEELADQIIAKVRKFQTPEITALFKEIIKNCRKTRR